MFQPPRVFTGLFLLRKFKKCIMMFVFLLEATEPLNLKAVQKYDN